MFENRSKTAFIEYSKVTVHEVLKSNLFQEKINKNCCQYFPHIGIYF